MPPHPAHHHALVRKPGALRGSKTVTIIVGVLHPGSMGAAIAAQARRVGATVLWCPAGRSAATKQRAQDADLLAVESLTELVDRSDILICLCPPAHADVVTEQVPA